MRALLKDLCPPILLRVLRKLRPAPSRPQPPAAEAAPQWCRVAAGPLEGCNLLLNTRAKAFAAMAQGSYDACLWEAMQGVDLNGGLLVDAGAHIGYHSLGLAMRYPAAQVVAFEPNPANLERINEHLKANPGPAARITTFPCALADAPGTGQFHMNSRVDDETSSGSHLQQAHQALPGQVYQQAGYSTQAVQVRTLDGIAAEQGWADVRLMKIDVEGAEHLLLRGATDLLRRHKPLLLLEVHGAACMLETLAVLQPLGYAVRLLHEEGAARCFVVASAH